MVTGASTCVGGCSLRDTLIVAITANFPEVDSSLATLNSCMTSSDFTGSKVVVLSIAGRAVPSSSRLAGRTTENQQL